MQTIEIKWQSGVLWTFQDHCEYKTCPYKAKSGRKTVYTNCGTACQNNAQKSDSTRYEWEHMIKHTL